LPNRQTNVNFITEKIPFLNVHSTETVKSKTFSVNIDEYGVVKPIGKSLSYNEAFSLLLNKIESLGFRERYFNEDHIEYAQSYYDWVFQNGGSLPQVVLLKTESN
jgi:hypothetical protein